MRISADAAGPVMAGGLTENGNRIGQFTMGGTLSLIIFGGALAGLAGSALVVGSDPWLRWLGRFRGLGFAVVALAVSTPFGSSDFVVLDPPGLNVALFLVLYLAFGLVVVALFRLFDSRLPAAAASEQPGYLVGLALGGLGLVMVMALLTMPSFCGCDPYYAMGICVFVLAASSAIRFASSVTEGLPAWLTSGAAMTGYGSLATLLALGLSRDIDQIQKIL